MKKRALNSGIISIFLIGLMFACGGGGGGIIQPNNDPGSMSGTWIGTWTNGLITSEVTVVISNTGWTLSTAMSPDFDKGSFHRVNNTATLYSDSLVGVAIGTVTLNLPYSTIEIVLNSHADEYEGTHAGTRSHTTNNNTAGDMAATWSGSIMSEGTTFPLAIVVNNSGWNIRFADYLGAYTDWDNGTFHRIGNVASLYSNALSKYVGNATIINANTITVYQNSNAQIGGGTTNTLYRNNFIGTWSGSLEIPEVGTVTLTSTVTACTWRVVIEGVMDETGVYIMTGSLNSTYYNDKAENVGYAILSNNNNTVTVTLTEDGDIPPGTYLFNRQP